MTAPGVHAHRCTPLCVCPLHRTPLFFHPQGQRHACQDVDCMFGHGLENTPFVDLFIRGTHPAAYRSGEWGRLISITRHSNGRMCYLVRFADQDSDWWPWDDAQAGYELRHGAE